MRVHVIQSGRLRGNMAFLRSDGRNLIRAVIKARIEDFPVFTYILEHDDGHIAIDTGLNSRARLPRFFNRMAPLPISGAEEEIGPQMRKIGLRAEDVRLVLITHLDWDHVGGVGHFPHAEVLVHKPEWDFASTWFGKIRYQPKLWPEWFEPNTYELDSVPLGPFPVSKQITDKGDINIVPIPGHSIAQVGVVVRTDGPTLFFGADHMLSASFFAQDVADNRLNMLSIYKKKGRETSLRIAQFVRDRPTILLPAHDGNAAKNLAANEPLEV